MHEDYILPQEGSITANDCARLLQAIKRGEVDEFDLKNEINAQWTKGYRVGAEYARQQAGDTQKTLARLEETLKTIKENKK